MMSDISSEQSGRYGSRFALERRVVLQHEIATPFMVLALLSFFLLLGSTVYFQSHRTSFSSIDAIDNLAWFKTIVRLLCLGIASWLFFACHLSWRDILSRGTLLLFLYYSFAFVTSVVSVNPQVSATRSASFIIILLYGSVLVHSFHQLGVLNEFWKATYISFGVYTVCALFGSHLVYDPAWQHHGVSRLAGLYPPNIAAALAGIAFVWSFISLHQKRYIVPSLAFLGAASAMLILAVSRGALLFVFVTCVGYVLWRQAFGRTGTAITVAAALVAMLAAASVSRRVEGYLTRGQPTEELHTGTGRTPLYAELLTIHYPQRPWFGYGFQMVSARGPIVAVPVGPRGSWDTRHTHSSLLQALVGTGILGLMLLIVAWGRITLDALARLRTGNPIAEQSWFLLLFVVGHSLIETTLSGTVDPPFIILSLVCGTLTLARPSQPAEQRHAG
jgi:O-antigen ligase